MKIKAVLVILFVLSFLLPSAYAQTYLGTLKVQVKDFYSNLPLRGAKVTITPNNYSGTTDRNGELEINNVMPFRGYQVKAEKRGYIAGEVGFVSVNAKTETISVVPLKQKGTVTGTVTGEKEQLPSRSSPLRDAVVILGKVEDSILVASQTAFTDARGKFTFDVVDEDTYQIIAFKDGYQKGEIRDVTVTAGGNSQVHFTLIQKTPSQSISPEFIITNSDGEPLEAPYTAPARYFFTVENPAGIQEFYWIKEKVPEGALFTETEGYFGDPSGSMYTFTLPLLGDYTVTLLAVNGEGIVEKARLNFSAVNFPPEAVPSVIPGPTELPLIENSTRYTNTTGSASVTAGSPVYLRGFGVDVNLLSPADFNPDAPSFDLYENKNGDFRASLFAYSWSLRDKNGTDKSSLLSPSVNAENVSFTVPQSAQSGDTYTASLIVTDDLGAESQPSNVTITVAQNTDQANCSGCHSTIASGYATTVHAQPAHEIGCQSCHGPGSQHVAGGGSPKLTKSPWPGVCGQCHGQFAELQKANHSDPLPFGYFEPTDGRITSCYRCHYMQGYIGAVESGTPFNKFRYGSDALSQIPKDSPNVSCAVCHDPHQAASGNPYGLRTGSAGTACDTCHYEKWQNAILEGMAGSVKNGYHYPGEDYSIYAGSNNPHRTTEKCVKCHMETSITDTDSARVRKVGGHTLRMRDFGADQIPETSDDLLNIAVCQGCHSGLNSFDRNGVQTEVKGLLTQLSNLLKGNNHGFLPPNKPGNCNRCHKGGTVPFLNDSNSVLENAYTNYKLFLHDRSYGIHNPGYTKKLLQDSINSVLSSYPAALKREKFQK